jgi:hypothetical protein
MGGTTIAFLALLGLAAVIMLTPPPKPDRNLTDYVGEGLPAIIGLFA